MGFIGASPGVLPPNSPPEWTSTPNPLLTAGVGGTYDLKTNVFDPESDTLTFVKVSGTFEAWMSLNSNGVITLTAAAVEGTYTGFSFSADDGIASPVTSTSFSIEVVADTNKHVAKTGSDANAGTQALPWLTIQYATDNATAGDTIFVHEGSYNERVEIGVSGSVGNYITLRNFPGETAILDGTSLGNGTMIRGQGIEYYKVIDLEIRNHVGGGIAFYAGEIAATDPGLSHIEIRDNWIHDQTHESGNGHAIYVIAIYIPEWGTPEYTDHLIEDVIVDGNLIGPNVDTGTPGIFDECLTLAFNIKRFQITNNVIDDASHIVLDLIGKDAWNSGGGGPALNPAFPQYGLIAGNTVKNSGFLSSLTNSMFHADGCKDIVVEDNLIYDCAGHGLDCNAEDDDFNNERMIYRRNRVLRTDPSGIFIGGVVSDSNNIRWAHNSVFHDHTADPRWGMAAGGGIDIVLKNNVIQTTDGSDEGFVFNHYLRTGSIFTLDYNLYQFSTSNYKWQGSTEFGATAFADYQTASGQDANTITGDPLYVDAANNDLTPDTGSPAINAGTALTNANGSGSSSQTLIVDDSRWFHDGMGIEGLAGDTIRVGANTVVITAINYSTNTLTLDSAISWSDNDDVSYPYNGAAPDMGAIET